jgi:hypothetical protein
VTQAVVISAGVTDDVARGETTVPVSVTALHARVAGRVKGLLNQLNEQKRPRPIKADENQIRSVGEVSTCGLHE